MEEGSAYMLTGIDNITSGFVVYPQVIKRHVNDELPFMAT